MPHHLAIPTRWADNDVYGHVNNVEFYAFFDTVINAYLIDPGGLDIHAATSSASASSRTAGSTGRSRSRRSSTRGCASRTSDGRACATRSALFGEGQEEPAAEGWFVHVFVDREQRRPAAIPDGVRAALQRLT